MANIFTKATVGIEVETQPAKYKIAELEAKVDGMIAKKKKLEAAGDLKGAAKLQTQINKVQRQLDNARTASARCTAALKNLNQAAPNELRIALRMLKDDLNHIERGSSAWKSHVAAIKRVKAELNSVNAELTEGEGLFSRMNRKVNEWGMSIASAAAGFTGLVFSSKQAVQAYADMQQEEANVQKFTGMTASEVEHLNEQFKKMDTRTSRENLNKLAQEAGRLGLQSEEDVLGFVRAADKINIALDDLGEGATLTLSKLTDIFGDKERYGVEQSLLKVGSVVNELSQNCTASAPYLTDFAQRMAGVGRQANLSIPQIMGFAAVLDSQGQAVEMSATALSQLIMKMFQNPAKIAKATGMDLQSFNKVLKEDTNQALLMLLQRLHEMGDISALAPVFDAMGTDGARASQVIAALAGNIGMIKQQQSAANQAFREGTSVTKEYNIQNNTVQAQLEKAKKNFHETAVALGEKLAPAMQHVISGSSLFINVLSAIVSFMSKYSATLISTATAIGLYTLAVNASVVADKLKVLWTDKIMVGLKNLWKVIAANPWGALAAAMGVVIGVLIDLARDTDSAAAAQKTLNDVQTEGKKKAAEQKVYISALMAAARNLNLTYAEQKTAVDKLNKLIPGFNGKINAQTRSFTYSKNALNEYNNQLARLYALEGAKEKLKELGAKKAELVAERATQQEAINEERKNVPTSPTPQTSGGPTVPAGVGAAAGHTFALASMQLELNKTNNEIKKVDASYNALIKEFGKDLQKDAIKPQAPVIPESKITTTDTPAESSGGSSHTGKPTTPGKLGGSTGNKTTNNATEAQKKELDAQLSELKKKMSKSIEMYRTSYFAGESDYATYLDNKYNATKDYYSNAEKLYKKYEGEQSKNAEDMRKKRETADADYKKDRTKLILDQYAYERDLQKSNAKMEFYNPDNAEAFKNQRVLDDKLAQIDIEYLRKVMEAQTEDTKAREDARINLEKAEQAEALRQRKRMAADLSAWLYIYDQQGAEKRMEAELAVVDELHKQDKLKTEEVEEAKAAIRKKYRDEVNTKTGTKAKNQDYDDAKLTFDNQMEALEDAYSQGLISQEDYESRRWQIIQNYHNKVVELVNGEGNEWATLVTKLVETWKAGFDDLGSTLPEKLKAIAAMAASTFAVMNAGIQSYTSFANAQRDLELAKVEKNYQAQIDAAGNNDKKKKELEAQKSAAIAKIKTKYDKRAMTMEMAQAVASTAMAAINAYASAAAVPVIGHIIAPIAASMALAAGAIQIATIKKSHQAQQAGYYSGGFTSRNNNNRREVGVVHANEFVANHEAVANPELLPVLRLIDQAQRNNTVGSLTSADVSRALGQGELRGEAAVIQRRSADSENRSMQLVAASMQQQTAAVNELNARLADGIESYMVMDGERGFDRLWQRYQRMKENPKR